MVGPTGLGPWLERLAYLGLAALALWSRFAGLSSSFWNDELYTVAHYVSKGPAAIFAGDYVPNNHLAYSFVAWLLTIVVEPSEFVLRSISVVASLAAIAWVTISLRKNGQCLAALAFAWFAVTSPLITELTRQARGYGFTFLAMAGLLVMVLDWGRVSNRRSGWFLFGASVLGIAALPVFVLPVLACAGALVATKSNPKIVIWSIAAAGLASLGIYSQLLGQLVQSTSQQFGEQLQWYAVVFKAGEDFVVPTLRLFWDTGVYRHVPLPHSTIYLVLQTLILILVALGYRYANRYARHLGPLLWGLVLLPYVALMLLQFFVADRFVCFLAFPLFVLFAFGIAEIARALEASDGWRELAAASLVLVTCLATFKYTDATAHQVYMPKENFKGAAEVVRALPAVPVLTDSVRSLGFRYYLPDADFEIVSSTSTLCRRGGEFVFIHHPYRNAPPELQCLDGRLKSETRVHQSGRGGFMDVYHFSAAPSGSFSDRRRGHRERKADSSIPSELAE